MSAWLASWIWSADEDEKPKRQYAPTTAVAQCTYNVDNDELSNVKANLKAVETRVAPKTYASRIPHIAEMAELHKKYRREQRKIRKSKAAKMCERPPTPPPLPMLILDGTVDEEGNPNFMYVPTPPPLPVNTMVDTMVDTTTIVAHYNQQFCYGADTLPPVELPPVSPSPDAPPVFELGLPSLTPYHMLADRPQKKTRRGRRGGRYGRARSRSLTYTSSPLTSSPLRVIDEE